jgi:mono/diheme cytochrome c family protein
MSRFGAWTGITGFGRRGLRRAWVLGASMTLALVLAGCGDVIPSTNTYPIDFFSEMHFSKAWTAGEPDGWNPPEGAVPITGGEIDYSEEEAAELENPFNANTELGQHVYAINCAHCHGPEGAGDGIVGAFLTGYDGPEPANLQESDLNDGQMFWVVTNGIPPNMPAFKRLLTPEERWAVVDYLRTLE